MQIVKTGGLLSLLFFFFIILAAPIFNRTFIVEESDGSPSLPGIWKIIVDNGSLSGSAGQATIALSSASGDFADGGEAGGADRTLGNTDNFDIGFLTNNLTRLHIQNDGSVGIGVTDPDTPLEIFNAGTQLKLSFDADSFATFSLDTNDDLAMTPAASGGIRLQPTTDTTDFFQVLDQDGGTPVLNVDSTNERVGIGMATPETKLHVFVGDSGIAPDTNSHLLVENSSHSFINILSGSATQAGIYLGNSVDGALAGRITYIGQTNILGFGNMTNNHINIDSSGNIGIGTSTFGTNLAGGIAITNDTAATATITDGVQLWATDHATGDSRLYVMGELSTNTISLGNGVISADTTRIKNSAEGNTASLNIQTARESHTLAAAATSDTSIDLPSGVLLLGASLNVDTAVTDDAGDDTWSAEFHDGSSMHSIASGAAAAQNTKVNKMIDAATIATVTDATTNIRFTPNAGNFSAGVIEVIIYYIDLTSLGDV